MKLINKKIRFGFFRIKPGEIFYNIEQKVYKFADMEFSNITIKYRQKMSYSYIAEDLNQAVEKVYPFEQSKLLLNNPSAYKYYDCVAYDVIRNHGEEDFIKKLIKIHNNEFTDDCLCA
jgi:hypothetical protein